MDLVLIWIRPDPKFLDLVWIRNQLDPKILDPVHPYIPPCTLLKCTVPTVNGTMGISLPLYCTSSANTYSWHHSAAVLNLTKLYPLSTVPNGPPTTSYLRAKFQLQTICSSEILVDEKSIVYNHPATYLPTQPISQLNYYNTSNKHTVIWEDC